MALLEDIFSLTTKEMGVWLMNHSTHFVDKNRADFENLKVGEFFIVDLDTKINEIWLCEKLEEPIELNRELWQSFPHALLVDEADKYFKQFNGLWKVPNQWFKH